MSNLCLSQCHLAGDLHKTVIWWHRLVETANWNVSLISQNEELWEIKQCLIKIPVTDISLALNFNWLKQVTWLNSTLRVYGSASMITSVFLTVDDKLVFVKAWNYFCLHLYLGHFITTKNNGVHICVGRVGGVSLTLAL